MERGGRDPRRLEGAAAAQLPHLPGRVVGAERSRRAHGARWPPVEEDRHVILAGDIGGTNTRLAFVEERDGRLVPVTEAAFASREHASLETVLRQFVAARRHPVTRAAFGVAGPVRHGRCDATNLPWVVDARLVAREIGLQSVGLINDLEANAWGIPALQPEDFAVLNQGEADAEGNAAIISAGTGLGEAG